VECTAFAWGCVVWYNVWCDAGGISCGWDTVTCSAGCDTRARRGDTLVPDQRTRYSISVGWMVGTGDPGAHLARRRVAERVALVRGGQGERETRSPATRDQHA
jgi:hypothetical protein